MLLPEEVVRKVIERRLKRNDFNILDYKLVTPTEDAFGFLSNNNILKLKVQVGDDISEFRCFAKLSVYDNRYHEHLANSMGANTKEMHIYNEILPQIGKYTKEKFHPDCYYCDKELLIMEDLSEEGYRTKDVHDPFDTAHQEVALSKLALLHAGSLAYEIQEGIKMSEKHSDIMYETLFSSDKESPIYNYRTSTIQVLRNVINHCFPKTPVPLVEKTMKLIDDIPKNVRPSQNEVNVLSHGDLWCNNIMFKDDQQEKPSALIIDFQLARFTPPALDALLTVYLTSDKKVRDNKDRGMAHFMLYYYNELERNLKECDIPLEKYISLDEFKESCKKHLPTAVAIAATYFHYVTMPKDIVSSVMKSERGYQQYVEEDRTEHVLKVLNVDSNYYNRLTEILDDLLNVVKYGRLW